jgi:hypothetical protein
MPAARHGVVLRVCAGYTTTLQLCTMVAPWEGIKSLKLSHLSRVEFLFFFSFPRRPFSFSIRPVLVLPSAIKPLALFASRGPHLTVRQLVLLPLDCVSCCRRCYRHPCKEKRWCCFQHQLRA